MHVKFTGLFYTPKGRPIARPFLTGPMMHTCQHPYRMQSVVEGLSHGLKTCHRHVFLTAFRVRLPYQKRDRPLARPFLAGPMMHTCQHPYRMQSVAHGLSHGLKTCQRHVFLTAFRVRLPYQKRDRPFGRPLFWCERWDSNPHGETTRTSNVLVYHSNTLAKRTKVL